ncbi:methyltransferase domain-containing protein [uncultured Cetobacterium sp.]|uniref:methyltransferase domain-containing protein n=1 Tax=uncultured Cetobacterium sp. TaxID=527638 RepID=UPI0026238F4A|nr:methyltransferase domain-containing protein [uncultured Cetobacterium sp.]
MNFNKQFINYDQNAITQKKVAEKLFSFIDCSKKYQSILELGCGTGVFTKTFYNNLNFNILDLNDIFDTAKYFSEFSYNKFFIEDMENLKLEKYSLVLSSSAFQWVDNFENLIKRISENSPELIFSIYSKGNLIEIFQHFGISLNYLSCSEILTVLNRYYSDIKYETEEFVLKFNSPIDALKHLKKTGVTGFKNSSYSLTKSFKSTILTYRVSYFSCKK